MGMAFGRREAGHRFASVTHSHHRELRLAGRLPPTAPLPLTRSAVAVPIHLRSRTVAQEERRLFARRHLRAMGPAVAAKRACGRTRGQGARRIWGDGGRRRHPGAMGGELRVRVTAQGDEYQGGRNALQPETATGVALPSVLASNFGRYGRGLPRALDIDRSLLAIASRLDLEGQRFTELRAPAIPWEGRDMHEDRLAAAQRRDESESAVVVPLLESALEPHS